MASVQPRTDLPKFRLLSKQPPTLPPPESKEQLWDVGSESRRRNVWIVWSVWFVEWKWNPQTKPRDWIAGFVKHVPPNAFLSTNVSTLVWKPLLEIDFVDRFSVVIVWDGGRSNLAAYINRFENVSAKNEIIISIRFLKVWGLKHLALKENNSARSTIQNTRFDRIRLLVI